MPRYHNINGNKVQFTAEEETARDAEEKAWADAAPARALADLRAKRNRLLAATDYYGLSDVTMSDDMKTDKILETCLQVKILLRNVKTLRGQLNRSTA
jgi:hypothetical protein